jgi:hypothetical protein
MQLYMQQFIKSNLLLIKLLQEQIKFIHFYSLSYRLIMKTRKSGLIFSLLFFKHFS